MTKIVLPFTLLAIIFVRALHAAPAQAQEIRTFVSSSGNDSDNASAPPRPAGTSRPLTPRRLPEARSTCSIPATTAR